MSFRTASRGRRGIRGRGGRKSGERPQKSVADLDAEMEVGAIALHCGPLLIVDNNRIILLLTRDLQHLQRWLK